MSDTEELPPESRAADGIWTICPRCLCVVADSVGHEAYCASRLPVTEGDG